MAASTHSLYRLHLQIPSFRIPTSCNSCPSLSLSSLSSQNSFLGTLSFSITPHSRVFPISPTTKLRSITATISFNRPTSNPDNAAAEQTAKWSWRAIKSFAMGQLEAWKLRYANTGTESLLMGIIIEGTSLAAKFLRAHGITLTKVREECTKLLGQGHMFYCSPMNPPLTESAQKALDWAVNHKLNSGENGEVTTTDMVLGIWSEKDSPGHKILAALGFDDEKAEELKTLSSKPGFHEG